MAHHWKGYEPAGQHSAAQYDTARLRKRTEDKRCSVRMTWAAGLYRGVIRMTGGIYHSQRTAECCRHFSVSSDRHTQEPHTGPVHITNHNKPLYTRVSITNAPVPLTCSWPRDCYLSIWVQEAGLHLLRHLLHNVLGQCTPGTCSRRFPLGEHRVNDDPEQHLWQHSTARHSMVEQASGKRCRQAEDTSSLTTAAAVR